jgi:hypothetical protein
MNKAAMNIVEHVFLLYVGASNIYNELKKLDSRKPNNPIKKWGSEMNKEFSPEEY